MSDIYSSIMKDQLLSNGWIINEDNETFTIPKEMLELISEKKFSIGDAFRIEDILIE